MAMMVAAWNVKAVTLAIRSVECVFSESYAEAHKMKSNAA